MKDKIAATLLGLTESFSYQSITVTVLCEAVPISRQTFYHYFHSKDEVAEWFIIKDFTENALPLFRHHLKERGAAVFFTYIKDHPVFYRRLYEYRDGLFLERCLRAAYDYAANQSKLFSRKVEPKSDRINPEVYRCYAASGIASVVLYWIRENMEIPIESVARDLYLMMEMPLGDVRDYYFNQP